MSVPVGFALIGTVSVRPAAGFTGGGRVQSSDQRIDCTIAPVTGAFSGSCDAVYAAGAPVSLALTSFTAPGFYGAWSGLCTATTTSCSFTANAAGGTVRVSLPELVNLSYDWTGAGSVATAFSDSAGRLVSCAGLPASFQCTAVAPEGSTVTFTATSQFAGWFQGWTDGCAAAGTAPTCTRTVPFRTAGNPPYVVGARFDFEALVDVNGGAGTVTLQGATGPNSACTNVGLGTTSCSLRSPTRTATFVATPAVGNVLVGWDGFSCVAVVPTCTVDVTSASGRVTATFQAQGPVGLEFDRDPAATGEGRVITSFGTCNLPLSGRNGACSEVAQLGSTRSYTAQPFAGSQFVGWGGPCAGQPGTTCLLSPVVQGGTVTARFDLTPTQQLTVQGINSIDPGSGTVASAPGGIACSITGPTGNGACVAAFTTNANVSLTPTPAPGSVFVSWSGACTGSTVPCVVPMNGPRTVGALFDASPATTLTLAFTGLSNTNGTLTASNGLSCTGNSEALAGNGCPPGGGSVSTGQPVTVTPSASSGSAFVGWTTGPCTGLFVNPCVFTPVSPTTVTARFGTQVVVSVEVEQQGNANPGTYDARLLVETIRDTVSIVVPPVPLLVTGPYPMYAGDVVRFTATPSTGSFAGWAGDCSSFGSNPVCTLTITPGTSQVRARYFGAGVTLNRRPAARTP
ncbi:hypothetical protein [Roseisolibacter sp. H3M3-2]|uniref:InlB B-repeat-containing protein n=1 Tax=Roseisolibacter sp. H3M3-2 TaxID=3031323 RepID=UPI0023DB8E31|nr:hypothetical protein [Roseisolibacter sp. H3M3-2]MDF1504481.1 hypothetical protein [Roseisolibacter sp. H3M3-2]